MSFGKRHPTGQRFLERRSARREETQVTGEILVPGKPPQHCLITQLSDSGATLQLSSLFGTPNSFELRAFGRIYSARVIRKAPRTLFVTFNSEVRAASLFSSFYPAA
jgi:hypothetical protein